MAKIIGSQLRETLEEANAYLWKRLNKNEVLLKYYGLPDHRPELWVKRDDHAGYVIEIDGKGYEFVRVTTE